MTFATADRVVGTDTARVFDGLDNSWTPLAGQPGTVQAEAAGYVWVIFDDDTIHDRFGSIPMYPGRLARA